MAFGIRKQELDAWKEKVQNGEIAFLTHFWYDPRFPEYTTVTKVGCGDVNKLAAWGIKYGLRKEWIHQRNSFPHFDLLGEKQKNILQQEGLIDHIERFHLR
ncbi:hypothetical protein [Thermaerobacillus caldiproteolyticus]|uniref:YneQ n=1 Tax=Thermaerobacillus caldiproteolyticus TaxID=247480 RepID=A0A7V9Z7N1_9BACL|nr:hypothetical protein [Anoxybacillus caldiproteolyticus]MBA2875474.1 hypothetical protein [Anoxybacillus caldiproteolyticus]QPA32718.1 hypothetical protein ISX45_07325 [Anoxybacillus caldiproteolyticus]